ncbi:ADP-ribosylglycohydrolase family protein, partial [Deinococcus fonticola]|uniref:ADP-ribosylglycohydrolase family protein n=1 Tax=Deinococcus fonticola TaxID=2528713 RepID=UPI001074B614
MSIATLHAQQGTELLIAAAVGDALGAATEFMTPEEAQQVYPERPYAFARSDWRDMRPGDATDDTQLAICVWQALSLNAAESGEQFVSSLQRRFACWLESSPPDAGSTLQRALQLGPMATWARYGEAAASNGSLMRAHAVSAAMPTSFEEMVRLSVLSSAATHAAPEAIWSCLYNNVLTSQLQGGERWTDVIWSSGLHPRRRTGGQVTSGLDDTGPQTLPGARTPDWSVIASRCTG